MAHFQAAHKAGFPDLVNQPPWFRISTAAHFSTRSFTEASAGDVILMHSLLLHPGAPAAHLGKHPRFLLNQDIYQPYW